MTEPVGDEPLDLQHAQFDAPPPALTCHRCQQSLVARYFSVNGQGTCAACLERAKREQRSSFPKALLLGSATAAVGAVLYYGLSLWMNNWSLFTILIGI